jgi:hypothetical protein
MTFPCICVLYPELVHPLLFSPFCLSLLLMVISIGLKDALVPAVCQIQ